MTKKEEFLAVAKEQGCYYIYDCLICKKQLFRHKRKLNFEKITMMCFDCRNWEISKSTDSVASAKKLLIQKCLARANFIRDEKQNLILECKKCKIEIKISKDSNVRYNNLTNFIQTNCEFCEDCRLKFKKEKELENRIFKYSKILYNKILDSAKKRNISVSLTFFEFMDFMKIENCHYCSSDIKWATSTRDSMAYNLDRKDNSLGYSKENCVVCCGDCNFKKGSRFEYEEYKVAMKAIQDWKLKKDPFGYNLK